MYDVYLRMIGPKKSELFSGALCNLFLQNQLKLKNKIKTIQSGYYILEETSQIEFMLRWYGLGWIQF